MCSHHLLLTFALCFSLCGCSVKIDDSFEVASNAVSRALQIEANSFSADSTVEQLGGNQDDADKVFRTIERYYSISISEQERKDVGGESGWRHVSATSLSKLIRRRGVQYSGGHSSYENLDL